MGSADFQCGLTKLENMTPVSKQSVINAVCSATNQPIRALFMVLAQEKEACVAYHDDMALCLSVTDESPMDHQLSDELGSSDPTERQVFACLFSSLCAFVLPSKGPK